MSGLVIDRDRCVACGACIAECPGHVLAMVDDTASVAAEERCIVCGHCVAVCPEDAVRHSGLAGAYDALDQTLAVEPRALMQLMRSRRSVRSYTDAPVSEEDLATLIRAGVSAPTAHNDQPWEFIVFRGRAKLKALGDAVAAFMEGLLRQLSDARGREVIAAAVPAHVFAGLQEMIPSFRLIVKAQKAGLDVIFRGAPALIVIHARRTAVAGVEDAHYAAANMLLMAHAMGLATCLIGFLVGTARNSPQISAGVGIPPDNEIGAALVVGHPKHRYPRIVPRRDPKVEWK